MFRRNVIKLFRLTISKSHQPVEEVKLYPNLLKRNPCLDCRCLTTQIQHANQNITNKLTEEEYLVKIRDDPDTFGGERPHEESYDEGDRREEEYLENPSDPTQKLRTKQYADMIKALIQKRKIKEAIDILEVRMLKNDRVKPESYIYNLLLGKYKLKIEIISTILFYY